jgi:hypothetical protein
MREAVAAGVDGAVAMAEGPPFPSPCPGRAAMPVRVAAGVAGAATRAAVARAAVARAAEPSTRGLVAAAADAVARAAEQPTRRRTERGSFAR